MKKEITKKEEDWIQKKWRPMMAIMYMVVCIFDFIIFPIGFTIVQFWEIQPENDKFRQWEPLTLVGAGLFHMAMGAVLGITAWSRGQEKLAGVAANPLANNQNNNVLSYQSPPVSTYAPPTNSFTSYSDNSYGQPMAVSAGYKGKKAPIQPEDPPI